MTKIYMYGVSEQEIPIAEKWEQLTDISVTMDPDILEADTVDRCKGYDGVSTYQYKKVDESVYETLKSYGIRNIAQRMAGYDPFDLELATKNDIIISNVPDYSPGSIAEYTVAQILNGLHHLYKIHDQVRQYDFRESLAIRGGRLARATVGIIGTGRIGRTVAHMVHDGFGAKVVGYDMYQNEEIKSILTYYDSVEEVVEKSDIISLHLPATEDTIHMFNDDLFARFKDKTILVNAGRGALIDTKALIRALDNGKVGFAALDTYENEFDFVKHDYRDRELNDPVLTELISRENVVYTPHIAYYTDESVENMVHRALQSTLEVISFNDARYRVN